MFNFSKIFPNKLYFCCSLGKEKGTIAQNQRSVVQYSVISERRNALCAINAQLNFI